MNPIIVDGYASLFNCTMVVRASDSMQNFNQWVRAWPYVFGLACCGSAIGFHLLWHTADFLCFRFDTLTKLGAIMRSELLCISVLRVASGPRVKLAGCKSALNPTVVYSKPHCGLFYWQVVPVLVLLFVALWFILQSDLF